MSGLIWVSLFWEIGYSYSAIGGSVTLGDVQFLDEEDGIYAKSHSISLDKAAKLGIKCVCPYCHVLWLFGEVMVFICNASVTINDRRCKGSDC